MGFRVVVYLTSGVPLGMDVEVWQFTKFEALVVIVYLQSTSYVMIYQISRSIELIARAIVGLRIDGEPEGPGEDDVLH